MTTLQVLKLDLLILDHDIQPRAELDPDTVAEYQELYEESKRNPNAPLPPPVRAYRIAGKFPVSRGFHRVTAARAAGLKTIEVEVMSGTHDDACLDAMRDNRTHGQRYKHADLVKQVSWLLSHEPYKGWGQAKLAEISGISVRTLKYIVEELRAVAAPPQQGIMQTCTIKPAEATPPTPEVAPQPVRVTPPGGTHPKTPGNPKGAGRKPGNCGITKAPPKKTSPAEKIVKALLPRLKELGTTKAERERLGEFAADKQQAIVALVDGQTVTSIGAAIGEFDKDGAAPRDKLKQVIPPKLRKHAADGWYIATEKAIKQAITDLKVRSGNAFLHPLEPIIEHMQTAATKIGDGAFGVVCQSCEGTGKDCGWCRSTGWMPAWALTDYRAKTGGKK